MSKRQDIGCAGFRQLWQGARREALTVGTATALGLTLPDWLRVRAMADEVNRRGSFGAAKKVIFLFLHGGHPQHETWDPKPQAPTEVRGEFGDISTAVSGLRIGELFPNCAKLADRLTIIRSMAHSNPNHVQACLPAMSGHKHPDSVRGRGDFPPSSSDFPHFGAVLDHLRRSQDLPTWVQLGPEMTRNNGTVLHGQSPGFLGRQHSPFIVNQDFLDNEVEIEAIEPRIAIGRLDSRRKLLAEIDAQRKQIDLAAASVKDTFYGRAFDLLTSPAVRDAFDLSAEPQAMRDRYPRSHVGQACLLARRLVEAGVPFVNVHWCRKPPASWDTHSQNFSKMKQTLGPTLDQTLAALITDLEERGLLDEVLVVPMAEFGRTPTINKNAGRDHWPFVYSLALAGAGLAPGVVYGKSDRLAAYPQSQPHDPSDMAATIYHLLGIPADTKLYDQQRRPHQLVIGEPIEPLLA
jgi:hypothetical protein